MAADPLKYAIVDLDEDCPRIKHFARRDCFLQQCRLNDNAFVPYCTFERRLRKDGRWLWHPNGTKFFDGNCARMRL